ncbi:MAG TPA: tRNA-binding protein [Candidatus Baltobacteraceae bacterium]|nr:tRNA-binding protein [Candidatus Baltobacteraceae bacterium]
MIDYAAFESVEMRVGTIVSVDPFPEARKAAYKLTIDFGEAIGTKRSSAQIVDLYAPESLIGAQVVAVVNFPAKRIAGFQSEVLVLGAADDSGRVVLLRPERSVPNGSRIY